MSLRWRWFGGCAVAVMIALAIGLLLNSEAGRIATGRWTFTESVETERDTYYRMKVNLSYRDAPQDFDIVVGCNVRRTLYRDGSSSNEGGRVPDVYGRKMSDNKTIAIVSPDACRGETTADGRVPRDFMPMVVVYQDETLGFGIAYATADAYGNALSELRFLGATIEKATHAEFHAFIKDGPLNSISRDAYHSIQSDFILEKRGLKRVWPPLATNCRTMVRFAVAQSAKEAVQTAWPDDRPRFWAPSMRDSATQSLLAALRGHLKRDPHGPESDALSAIVAVAAGASKGAINRLGGGRIIPSRNHQTPAPYLIPMLSAPAADRFLQSVAGNGAEKLSDAFVAHKTVSRGGNTVGQAYCTLFPAIYPDHHDDSNLLKREGIVLFDDITIQSNGIIVGGMPPRFFERDEYYYYPTDINLRSPGGDL